ncbi:hypothetical protein [Vagococcus fluvialis]
MTLAIQAPNEANSVKEKMAYFFTGLTSICENLIREGIEKKEFKQEVNP